MFILHKYIIIKYNIPCAELFEISNKLPILELGETSGEGFFDSPINVGFLNVDNSTSLHIGTDSSQISANNCCTVFDYFIIDRWMKVFIPNQSTLHKI